MSATFVVGGEWWQEVMARSKRRVQDVDASPEPLDCRAPTEHRHAPPAARFLCVCFVVIEHLALRARSPGEGQPYAALGLFGNTHTVRPLAGPACKAASKCAFSPLACTFLTLNTYCRG